MDVGHLLWSIFTWSICVRFDDITMYFGSCFFSLSFCSYPESVVARLDYFFLFVLRVC